MVPIDHTLKIIEGLAKGCNAQEGTGEETVGAGGDISTAYFPVRDPTGGSRMGDKGPIPKMGGGGGGGIGVLVFFM